MSLFGMFILGGGFAFLVLYLMAAIANAITLNVENKENKVNPPKFISPEQAAHDEMIDTIQIVANEQKQKKKELKNKLNTKFKSEEDSILELHYQRVQKIQEEIENYKKQIETIKKSRNEASFLQQYMKAVEANIKEFVKFEEIQNNLNGRTISFNRDNDELRFSTYRQYKNSLGINVHENECYGFYSVQYKYIMSISKLLINNQAQYFDNKNEYEKYQNYVETMLCDYIQSQKIEPLQKEVDRICTELMNPLIAEKEKKEEAWKKEITDSLFVKSSDIVNTDRIINEFNRLQECSSGIKKSYESQINENSQISESIRFVDETLKVAIETVKTFDNIIISDNLMNKINQLIKKCADSLIKIMKDLDTDIESKAIDQLNLENRILDENVLNKNQTMNG